MLNEKIPDFLPICLEAGSKKTGAEYLQQIGIDLMAKHDKKFHKFKKEHKDAHATDFYADKLIEISS